MTKTAKRKTEEVEYIHPEGLSPVSNTQLTARDVLKGLATVDLLDFVMRMNSQIEERQHTIVKINEILKTRTADCETIIKLVRVGELHD